MSLFRLAFVWSLTPAMLPGPLVAHAAADDPLAAVFNRMDQSAAKFKDLTADMKKVSYMAVLKEESVDVGKIAVRLPKKHDYHVLIDFSQPDQKQVQLAGTRVDSFYPKTNTDQIVDLGKTKRALIETFVLLGFGSNSKDLQDAFEIRYGGPEAAAGEPATRIELTPKDKEVARQFPKFELWISDRTGMSVQQKMYELGGDYLLATYTNMKINQNLPDTAVKLNLPKGVRREYVQR